MANKLIEAIKESSNVTTTWNGAKAYVSTKNANLDLFGKIGSSRGDVAQIKKLFINAFKEDPETATRILFYGRDVRGGQGERMVFRTLLKELASIDKNLVKKLVSTVPHYGRWDDLMILEDTLAWSTVLEHVKFQLKQDLDTDIGKPISLLAKWLPSINASSKVSKRIGRKIASSLGLTEKMYRVTLSVLRKQLDIPEQKMCARNWEEIVYDKLPSRAALMYRKAFMKHDSTRYQKYVQDVAAGKAKVNASTLYPYDIVKPFISSGYYGRTASQSATEKSLLDSQWKALPDYMEGNPFNGLVLCDVSGSMYSSYGNKSDLRPIDVSVSLAIYIAERNTGLWKNNFLAFDSIPRLAQVRGNTIEEKVNSVKNSTSYMGSTDLQAVVKLILDSAISNNLAQEDLPENLIIISDMQFNGSNAACRNTNLEALKIQYQNAGYQIPSIVFWNVNAAANVPIKIDDRGTCLVSGCSPSIMKSILSRREYTPLDMMNTAIYDARYDLIGEAFR
jgi:hypothetical protein